MRHRRRGYREPLLDPFDDVGYHSPIAATGGAAYVGDDSDDKVRVAGFTRPIDFATDAYVGKHRKTER